MQRNLKVVVKCRRTTYPTLDRARQVLWLMGTKGVDTSRLRTIPCPDCRQFHIGYTKQSRASV